jgi:hypothetical protein
MKPAGLGALVLALVVTAGGGCNGRFAFDQRERAGGSPDAALPDGPRASPDTNAAFDLTARPLDTGRARDDDPGPADTSPAADVTAAPEAALPADGSPAGPAACSAQSQECICSGTLCSCGRLQWCSFDGFGCGPTSGSCSFLCHNGTRCEGQCQHGCHLECENGSNCTLTMGDAASAEAEGSILTVTVGAMSHVQCENNATCHVTCTGPCTLSCQQGARCDLRCAGDDLPHSADSGGACSH